MQINPERFVYYSSLLACVPILLGFFVLVGWYANLPYLIQVLPSFAPMQYNTALGFLFCGAALLSHIFLKNKYISLSLAGVPLLLGSLTEVEYIFDMDIGLDEFFMEHYIDVTIGHPGRMAPNTALCFIFSGIAIITLLLKERTDKFYISLSLGVIVFGMGMVAFMGYVAGTKAIYGWEDFANMAVHTATGFMFVGVSITSLVLSKKLYSKEFIAYFICAVTFVCALNIDLLTPLGIAAGILYVPIILLTIWFPGKYISFIFAAIFSLVNFFGFYVVSEFVTEKWVSVFNRSLVFCIIWGASWVAYIAKKSNSELLENKNFLQNILNNTVDGIITINQIGTVEGYNPACKKIFGYKPGEVIGQNIKMLMPEPYHSEHDGYLSNYNRTKEAKIIGVGREVLGKKKDGTIFPIDLSISEVNVAGRRFYTGITRDITERKNAEMELKDTARKLKRSNEELETFTYIASHDLRGPLVNLRGFAAELERATDDINKILKKYLDKISKKEKEQIQEAIEEDIPKAVGFINNSVIKMDALTGAILELSRVGRKEMSFEAVDTSALATHCMGLFSHQIDEKGIEVKIDDNLPVITADYVSMQQVFSNIIDNAIKYLNPERSGKIEISSFEEDDWIKFTVKDNGKGIAEDNLHKVFEIFRRIDTSSVAGEGMGMAYVKSILERHGGEIWCESELGKGTTFFFTLPANLKISEKEKKYA